MQTYQATTEDLINQAIVDANSAVALARLNDGIRYSNGSEAWQAVQVRCDGRSRTAKDLKAMGYRKDYYWGFTIGAQDNEGKSISNYYAEEIWTQALEISLRKKGFDARRVERLL